MFPTRLGHVARLFHAPCVDFVLTRERAQRACRRPRVRTKSTHGAWKWRAAWTPRGKSPILTVYYYLSGKKAVDSPVLVLDILKNGSGVGPKGDEVNIPIQFILNHVTQTHGQYACHKLKLRNDGLLDWAIARLSHDESTANSSAIVHNPYIAYGGIYNLACITDSPSPEGVLILISGKQTRLVANESLSF